MRTLSLITALLLAASAAIAAPRYVDYEVSHGTNATTTLTQTRPINGYVDEIYVQAPSEAGVTCSVVLASSPAVGTALTPTTLYTNSALTAAAKAKPRFPQTDNEGADLSSLTVAERMLCVGDPVTLTIIQSTAVTGVTFRVWIKVD